ncbi:MAG TPA: ParB/RepB/Spo0J family partition protein [Ignavibacteriales bacterium]|jgi:ParB family chromosome partitioning protein|nr:ParB/RepB/Spo0J family partition protein [Ignavibacteriales bacterium]
MSKIKMGLGRGLEALINPDAAEAAISQTSLQTKDIEKDNGSDVDILAKISVNTIAPNPYQPRTEFEPQALEDLKKSILSNGLIQPITVRRNGEMQYELISGERRLRAYKEIGYKEIPAYIIKIDSVEAMIALALIENLQREDLNAIEVAQAYKKLMDECKLAPEEIAERVGKDRSTIVNFIRLLKLPKEVQDRLVKGDISAGHARALINLPGEKLQLEILGKILAGNLSVRKVEGLVKKALSSESGEGAKENFRQSPAHKLHIISQKDFEDKLRKIFGTKVSCKQKQDGSGEIVIEFFSNDELDRLYEMFEIIGKNYN